MGRCTTNFVGWGWVRGLGRFGVTTMCSSSSPLPHYLEQTAMSEPKLLDTTMPRLLPMLNRSEGVHVSDCIHTLALALGHYEESELTEASVIRMELGRSFEYALIAMMTKDNPDRYAQPGELELDDMFGTPDLFDTTDGAMEEIKLTWMSSNAEVDGKKFWRYWVQLKAYCKMWGASVGRLRVLFIMGDYRFDAGSGGPVYRVWEQRFTQEELDENWLMLLSAGGLR